MKNYADEFILSLMKADRNTNEKRKERAIMQRIENPLGTISGALLLFTTLFFFFMLIWSLL